MFSLTEESKTLGYLPVMNRAWELTPNPWWRFVTDQPAFQTPPPVNSSSSATRSSVQHSEKLLTEAEKEWMRNLITVRKSPQDKPVECLLKGSVHRMKMIQLAEAKSSGTILTKSSVGERGIIQHSVTLFRERLVSKEEVMGAWRLRDIEDASSLVLCDSSKISFKMMNILIWNCRGAMKPQFRKTVLDLVEWHAPLLMVITETRMSGARAIELIESLPFDGSVVADTIGFAGGIWMLWRTDLVHVDVLASTEQEIHAIIRVRSQSLTWIISAIYASPRFVERCMLWENLKLIATLHDLP